MHGAAANLADSLLAAQQAVRDDLLLTRHQALLDRPRGEPTRGRGTPKP